MIFLSEMEVPFDKLRERFFKPVPGLVEGQNIEDCSELWKFPSTSSGDEKQDWCGVTLRLLNLLDFCKTMHAELPIIQKTYDFIKWYIPILNKLPRDHKFNLGDRIIKQLYEFLEVLIQARYSREKSFLLEKLNSQLEIMRYQTRLLYDFSLINVDRYEYIAKQLNGIGNELGGWIKQQHKK